MALGFSYQPGQSETIHMNGGNPQGGLAPQSPAKILSLHLPKNLGQNPVAAQQLLTAPGAGGAPGLNAIIAALMRTVQPPMNGMGQMDNGRAQNGPQDYFHAGQGQLTPLSGAGSAFPGGGAGGQMDTPMPHIKIGEQENLGQDVNYGSPWAPGVTPLPGEGDAQHNPFYYDQPQAQPSKLTGLFDF